MKKLLSKIRQRRDENIGRQFLPEALEIIEKPTSPSVHFTIFIIIALILIVFAWSILGKIDRTVVSRGKVVTARGIQLIQPVEGGKVEEICVTEGEEVSEGQVIIRLDRSTDDITAGSLKDRVDLLKLENELLENILSQKTVPEGVEYGKNPDQKKVIDYVRSTLSEYETERQSLQLRVEQQKIQKELEEDNLNQISVTLEAVNIRLEAARQLAEGHGPENLTLAKLRQSISDKENEVEKFRILCEKDAIPRVQLEASEKELKQLKSDLEIQMARDRSESYNYSSQLYELQQQSDTLKEQKSTQQKNIDIAAGALKQAENELSSFEQNFLAKINGLMKENDTEILSQGASLEIRTAAAAQRDLVSPVNGIVESLEVSTEGGVVTAAQVLATVVPKDAHLLVEAYVMNRDIAAVKEGQTVTVKFDSYDFQKFGTADGTVAFVSPDAVFDESMGWFYEAKVEIDASKFLDKDRDMEILSGMECTVEIKAGERRIIDFFLEPLTEHFQNSLKAS